MEYERDGHGSLFGLRACRRCFFFVMTDLIPVLPDSLLAQRLGYIQKHRHLDAQASVSSVLRPGGLEPISCVGWTSNLREI